MTVKELYQKYKGYNIILFGKPLNKKTIPFTLLPSNKDMYECEVIEMKINNEKVKGCQCNFKKGKITSYEELGTVRAYIR